MSNINLCFCGGKQAIKYHNGVLCGKHYYRLRKYGDPFIKLVTDMNEYVKQRDYIEIILTGNKKCIINKNDFNLVKKLKWYLRKDGYVFNSNHRTTIHQLIMGKRHGLEIDHIDGNRLNNRRINLRYVTKEGNARNRCGISGIRKVYNKWQAYITINKKQKHLGMFATKEAAILSRKKAEKDFFPEFYNQS